MTTYRGRCHCGGIEFDAEGDIKQVMECNCSICSRKGSLLWFDQKGNKMAAINVRCLEGVDLAKLPVQKFDGRAL